MTQAKPPVKEATKPAATQPQLPKEFELRTSDIIGVWSMESGMPLRFIPTHAHVGDGKKFDKTKPSCLIFGKLTADTMLVAKGEDDDDDKVEIPGKVGDLIGLWAKPGMRDMATLCGVEVFIARTPDKDKDIGKGNDMKTFLIGSKESPNKLIPILVDRREESKGVRCILDPAGYGKGVTTVAGIDKGGSVPF